MSGLEEIIETQKNEYISKIRELTAPLNQLFNENLYNFLKYAETNDPSYLVKESEKLRAQRSETSTKENVDPDKRTKHKIPEVRVKQERVSIAPVKKNGPVRNSVDEMPAPTAGAIRKKNIKTENLDVPRAPPPIRSTRSRAKPNRYVDEQNQRPSDVIIQNTTITMIDISEDKEPEPEKKRKNSPEKKTTDDVQPKNDRPIRSTRTKTRQTKKQDLENTKIVANVEPIKEIGKEHTKRTRSTSRENVNVTQTLKKSKLSSSSEKEINKTAQTDYEDAVSNVDPNEAPDSNTMIINSTVIVENPKLVKTTNDNEESEVKKKKEEVKKDTWKTPPRTKSKKQQIKEIFSPFEKTSMKKKVEAFEKMGNSKEGFSASKIPLYKENGTSSDPGSAVKAKLYTPFSNKFMPKTCSTSRINKNPDKQQNSLYNDSGVSMKSMSALKASQAEYREREKRRQEKEMEAQLKKEALLQAQTEEKRRKREEKQMKALQQREMLQKEKEKQLEVQKIKEDKHKQMVSEKEERLQKSKEEAEKKRLLAKQKAKMLAKEKERSPEEAKMADTKPQGKNLPIYMVTRLPLLPTDDCYDSDDERYREKRYVKPDWCRDRNLTKQLYAQLISGEKIKNTLFGCINRSPDLVEMFENIDPRKLKRTSSAHWKKPPRYTLFSMTSDILFSEDSEDEKN